MSDGSSGSLSKSNARSILGDGEFRLLAILLGLTLALGALSLYVVPLLGSQDRSGDYIDYSVTLHPDGTLDETYTYSLTGNVATSMLYRYWKMPLVLGTTSFPYIEAIKVTPTTGSIAYVKDGGGVVNILGGLATQADVNTISERAYPSEAGCYNPDYYPAGTYTVSYTFKLFPEIMTDTSYNSLNLMLADEHLPYRSVRVVIEDAGYVTEVYPHPPSLYVSHDGSDIVLSGSSAENELLEFELLMPAGGHRFQAQLVGEDNVKVLTEQANRDYATRYWASAVLRFVSEAAVLVVPFLFVFLWMKGGREEDATVPRYLSEVPNPDRKPWLVNLLFKKKPNDFDEDSFYATLLDLQRNSKIRIEHREGGMKVTILDSSVQDNYEQRVMSFLAKFASNSSGSLAEPGNVFDTDTLKELAGRIRSGSGDSRALEAQSTLIGLMGDVSTSNLRRSLAIGIGLSVVICFVSYMAAQVGGTTLFMALGFSMMAVFGMPQFTDNPRLAGLIGAVGYATAIWIATRYDPQYFMFVMFLPFLLFVTLVFNMPGSGSAGLTETKKISNQYFIQGQRRVKLLYLLGVPFIIGSIIIYIFAWEFGYIAFTPLLLGFVVLGQVAIATHFPSTLFGRWMPGMYREKLQWDAFRNHLSDMSQLQKYSTADLNTWGSWLVYGTALGVGNRVAEAMNAFHIEPVVAPIPRAAHSHFHPIIVAAPPGRSGGRTGGHRGGGGGGGGHGGGGGRGGGGGGRR